MATDTQFKQSQIGAEVSLLLLASLIVALRLASRKMKGANLRADDYTIILAWIGATAFAAFNTWALYHRVLGIPEEQLTMPELVRYGQVIFTTTILGNLTYGFVKLSAALFYKSIFVSPGFTRAANIYIGLVAVWMLAGMLGQVLSLIPVSSWWTPSYVPSRCINYGAYLIAMASIDIVLDVAVLALPLVPIWRLHMATKHKVQLFGVFTLGFFCIISSAVRLFYTTQVVFVTLAGNDPSLEICTWLNVWSELEASASIVTTCIPTMGPLVAKSVDFARNMHSSIMNKHSLGSRSSAQDSDQSGEKGDPFASNLSKGGRPESAMELGTGTYNSIHRKDDSQVFYPGVPGIYVERSFSSGSLEEPSHRSSGIFGW